MWHLRSDGEAKSSPHDTGKGLAGEDGFVSHYFEKLFALMSATNVCHERDEYCNSKLLFGIFESRTAIWPSSAATSTQAPLPALRLAFRH